MNIFNFYKLKYLAVCSCFSCLSFAASPTLFVDFDQSGRKSSEVTEPNYVPWVVTGVTSKDTTLNGIKITVSKGSAGTSLKTNWYKGIVQSPYYARLVGDGIFVENGNAGGEITVSLSGLDTREHTFLAYLNNVDAETAYASFSAIDIYVNGSKVLSGITPKIRPTSTEEATKAFFKFNATKGSVTSITFKPSTASAAFRNVTLNGFALNVADVNSQSKEPLPENLEEHALHTNGALTLSFTPASNAVKHDIYFGTDSLTVLNADKNSSTFKGTQESASYKVQGATPLSFYFWRVDEIDSKGNTTKGNVWRFRIGRLAFKNAEGYGRNAIGGRLGKVVYVTNLNDNGPGSFREAVTNSIGPRTILFKVSGEIKLKSRLALSDDYVTVAGQSAPGKGIVITGAPFGVTGNNCIVRFIRVRRGFASTTEEQNRGLDGMGITGANHSIIDHASISWTTDEGFSSRGAKNITLQRTLISEALNIANHPNYPTGTGHGYAATIGGDVGSFHHNLLAHNAGRNWSLGGGLDGAGYYAGRLDIFNNVVYNWVSRVTDGGAHNVQFVGNYYKEGAATTLHGYTLRAQLEGTGNGTQEYYYHNNILEKANGSFTCNGTDDNCGREYQVTSSLQIVDWTVFVNKPYFESYAKVQSAKAAYKDVLSDVGMNKPLDEHDLRMIEETKNGSYTYTGSVGKKPGIPDRESDVGGLESYPQGARADDFDSDSDGLPDFWENLFGLNPKSGTGNFEDANKDRLGDGYTELERYLEFLAMPHYKLETDKSINVDLKEFTRGYNGGTYTVSNLPSGISASVNNSVLTISANENFSGVGYLTFTLKDSEGDTFSREIAVYGDTPVKENEPEIKLPQILKCGAGSQKQTLKPGDSLVAFCYTWENAETVEIEGFPKGITFDIDNENKIVWFRGIANDTPGAYSYEAKTIGGTEVVTKGGVLTITEGETSLNFIHDQNFKYHIENQAIHFYGLEGFTKVQITNSKGKHFNNKNIHANVQGKLSVSLENLPNGFYIIHVNNQKVKKSFRILNH